MKNQYNQPTQKIIGESFFHQQPKDAILLEKDFVRMDKSIIWKCSEFFWKHYAIWEKTFGEDFESSLPSGISESHRTEFIHQSAGRFLQLLNNLEKKQKLPEKIFVYEQGPGAGIFANEFLNYIQKNKKDFYSNITYILTDTSEEVLAECKLTLQDHKKHTQYFDQYTFENMKSFDGKIIFARHSNVWDGWPCRDIQVRKSGLGEVYVRALSDTKFKHIVDKIYAEGLEVALLYNKNQWKEFFRSIKLQKRTIPVDKIDIKEHMYLQHLSHTALDHIGSNTLMSDLIEQNLSFLKRLINWELGGYAEIVDIIAPEPRNIYPKKFDGSIGYIVDGHIIQTWAKNNNKDVILTPIRKLNTMVTITKNTTDKTYREILKNITHEIYPTETIIEESLVFPKGTHIAVTCTSKKGIDYTIEKTIQFKKMGFNAYPHVIARAIADDKNLEQILKKLKANKINEVFIAAGDTENIIGKFTSSVELLDGLQHVGFSFQELAVTGYPEGHPKIAGKKLLEALKKNQLFAQENGINERIITQMCFDADTTVKWANDLQKKGITLPIIVGIPGPCNLIQLVQFAKKCGVGQSFKFLTSKKSLGKNLLMNIATQYTPDKLILDILNHPLLLKTKVIGFHIYTFNNIKGVMKWQKKFIEQLKNEEKFNCAKRQ